MAKNQRYGYSFSSYGGAAPSHLPNSGMYVSKSLTDPYRPSDPSLLGSSRYLGSSDLLSSSSSSMLFTHTDGYSAAVNRIPGVSLTSPTASHLAPQVSWPGPPGVGVEIGTAHAASDLLDPGLKRSASDAKRPRIESAINLPVYPQRPGEKDCAHYMLTRTCKFGDSCKFDHPIWVPEGGIPDWKEVPLITDSESLPERPMEPDCPYFLKTQRCKFGSRCKFNHPKDKMSPLGSLENIDVAVLPERPSEPACAFYMKTGKCKYGATCKFHHPKDLQISLTGEENNDAQEGSLANSTKAGDLKPVKPFCSPAVMHNTKGLPIRPGEVDCPFYLKTGSCKYGPTCRYNHPDRNGGALVVSPAQRFNVGVANPAGSILESLDPRLSRTMIGLATTAYPQRPGEIECDFYMKTGDCKFGQRCKFHHPIDRSAPTASEKDSQLQNVKLTRAGLPRREGAIHCPYYMKTGACKYGATCKFDHPPPGEVMALAIGSNGGYGKEDEKVAESSKEQ